jgi:hypothetical protein
MLEEQLGYRSEANERYRMADELNQLLKERGIQATPEGSEMTDEGSIPTVSDTVLPDDRHSGIGQEIKKVFISKAAFSDFIRFIRNGFKLGSQKKSPSDQLPR